MEVLTVKFLLSASMVLYLFAALAALVFLKRHRLCSILSSATCIAASLFGLAAALRQLLFADSKLVMNLWQSNIPFLQLNLSMDALSAFFVLGLSLLVFCVSIYSIGYMRHYYGKRNVALFHFLYAGFILTMLLVFTAGNAVVFFVFWEAMAVTSYFLVSFESEESENQRAGILYIVMTHIGTAFLMIAFMMMFSFTGTFDFSAAGAALPQNARNLMFVFFLIGFGTKAGVIPFHIWLPYAHPAAPSTISALMSGIMIKTAIYGLLRFVFIYLGVETTWWGMAILIMGLFSAVLGVAYAYIEQNIKRMLAYSSIENMGIIFIGLGVSFMAFSEGLVLVGALALTAALLHTINHTLFKGSLFLGAGSIQYAVHSKNMEEMGGLIKRMPITALFFLGGALSVSAMLPFNGFISEWLTYQSIFAGIIPGQAAENILFIFAVAALALSGALAAACFIKLFGISFLGLPRSEQASSAQEVPLSMSMGSGILTAFCLLSGIFPLYMLNLINKVVLELSNQPITGQLQGNLFFIYYPLTIHGNMISPQVIVIALTVIAGAAFLMLRLIFGKQSERRYGTWDCGYESLSPRMQYSAAAFSKPIRVVFKIMFKSSRNLKIKGALTYHPDSMEYSVTTVSVFEKYIYDPVFRLATAFSSKAKFMIQTGSVHTYLLYIFMTVLILMLYNRVAG